MSFRTLNFSRRRNDLKLVLYSLVRYNRFHDLMIMRVKNTLKYVILMLVGIVIIDRINDSIFNRLIIHDVCMIFHILSSIWSESESNSWCSWLWPYFLYDYMYVLFEKTCFLPTGLFRIVFISKNALHWNILLNCFRKERHISGFYL
jgi:hypothetical protein